MQIYHIGAWHETYGRITVEAKTPEEAEKKAFEMLEDDGAEVINEITNREFNTTGVEATQ